MAGSRLLVAGGTGGHLFPARRWRWRCRRAAGRVHLATDQRVASYGRGLPGGSDPHHSVGDAVGARRSALVRRARYRLALGVRHARRLIKRLSSPTSWSASAAIRPCRRCWRRAARGVPTSSTSRTPCSAAPTVSRSACQPRSRPASPRSARRRAARRPRLVQTGNPVRPAVREAAATPYPAPRRASRSASSSSAAARARASSPSSCRRRSARFADELPSAAAHRAAMPARGHGPRRARPIGRWASTRRAAAVLPRPAGDGSPTAIWSCRRAGASTVAELGVIGRPAILVPLPHALDHDQKANARVLAEAGGGWMIEQTRPDADRLAGDLAALIDEPERLADGGRRRRARRRGPTRPSGLPTSSRRLPNGLRRRGKVVHSGSR